jgi:hypothetical protein
MKAHERLFEPERFLYDPRRSVRSRGQLPAPDMLDICRCPRCRGPLVARMGRNGPYFHCRCHGAPRSAGVGKRLDNMANPSNIH